MGMERVGPYKLEKTLGTGSSAKVKLGVHMETGEQVAIKILSKDKLLRDAKLLRRVEREIAVMKLVRHPHVLRLFDVFQSDAHLFLMLEYVSGGELYSYVKAHAPLTLEEAFHFFSQAVEGLAYCHDNLICHRDLKLENLLLDKNLNVKIADFGMASMMRPGDILATSCGSPHYASPEVVRGDRYNGFQSDVWSLGVILYALTTNRLPFDAESLPRLLTKVRLGVFALPKDLDPDLSDLLRKMMAFDPRRRIQLREIPEHPWFIQMHKSYHKPDVTWHKDQPNASTIMGQMYRFSDLSLLGSGSANKEDDGEHSGREDIELVGGIQDGTEPPTEAEEVRADPIVDVDEEILVTVQSLLGGLEASEIVANLRSEEITVEKICYKLLLDQKLHPERGGSTSSSSEALSHSEPLVSPSSVHESEAVSSSQSQFADTSTPSTVESNTTSAPPTSSASSDPQPGIRTSISNPNSFTFFTSHPINEVLSELNRIANAYGLPSLVPVDGANWRSSDDSVAILARVIPLDIPLHGLCVEITRTSGDSTTLFSLLHENLQL